MPSLIANNFCVWKLLPFLMNTVYSTTISPLPYPNVLIVDGEPALAVNEPERLVVIPTSVPPDIVVEYTVFIKNGSNFQSQKLLAMRDGTTIHSTQFAVMFSSSLLVQLDATISSGNILLRATPETGVSGSTTYKVKREVM